MKNWNWTWILTATMIMGALVLSGSKGGCLPEPEEPVEPAPNACVETSDCAQFIVYYKDVKSEKDCYCPMCDSGKVDLNKETLAKYKKNYETICTAWEKKNPCPIPKCIMPKGRECIEATCQTTPEPESFCTETSGCATYTTYYKPVEKPEDCYCVMCPRNDVSLNYQTHQLYMNQWKHHCSDFKTWRDYPCPIPMCIQPFPKTCKDNHCTSEGPKLEADNLTSSDK